MSQCERIARVEGIDETTGVFSMTLATEGEASDGHILSIKGGQIPERMPLLISHYNEPTSQAGSITEPKKALKDSPPCLRAVGRIEMSGEGPSAEIRRDLAHMIARGHVNAMSIRWDEVPGKTIRRVNLPSEHPHYVDSERADGPERWGCFFEEWVAREGSIVALGADKGALIGRAEETEGEVSTFWRAMASDLESPPDEDVVIALELDEPTEEAKQAAALAALRADLAQCRDMGIADTEINEILGTDTPSAPDLVDEVLLRLDALEGRFDDLEAAREDGREEVPPPPAADEQEREDTGDPLPPAIMRPREVAAMLREELKKSQDRINSKFRAEIKKARGEIER